MRTLDAIEERIWNVGERLIPGVTHDTAEVVRHKSSYQFFRKVIENDLFSGRLGKSQVHILDIGCGVGHGTYMLAGIHGAMVTGIDCSEEAIVYAKMHYGRDNVTYVVAGAADFIKSMSEFDYVVSRHSLEHIADGLKLGAECKFRARLMINVPFGEPEGNPHHQVHFIRQDSFDSYPNRELFYESLAGVTLRDYPEKPPNSIVCISSKARFPEVAPQLSFPFPAWKPEFLQGKWLTAVDRQTDFESLTQLQVGRGLELTGRETRVVNRESEVASREAELSGRESRVSVRESELGAREQQLIGGEAELSGRESRVSVRESELGAREQQLIGGEAELSDRESRVSVRESELGAREQQIIVRETELSGREARSTIRDAELAAREGGLAVREADSSERTKEIQLREQELAQLVSEQRNRHTQLMDRQEELDKLIRSFEGRVIVRAYRRIRHLL